MDFAVVSIVLSVLFFYHVGAVLTPNIVAVNLTYTGIRKVKREVMQQCHYTFSYATSIGTLKNKVA